MKAEDKVLELARSMSAMRGKFLRHLASKSPETSKLEAYAEQYAQFLETFKEEAEAENAALFASVNRLQEVEEQKQELLRALQGGIPETGKPVE